MLAMATTSPTSIPVADRVHQFTYAIRNIVAEARAVEATGKTVRYLNIGDPIPFGFPTPPALVEIVTKAMTDGANGYVPSPGIQPARDAVAQEWSGRGFPVSPDRVLITAGTSEGIELALTALANPGDRVLVPLPTYPLYTAVLAKIGADPAFYRTDPARGWIPDLEHLESLITPRTRALVLIDPNNPTGAVYPAPIRRALLDLAERHGLVILADEVYDKVLYDGARHTAIASLSNDVLTLTFNSLSKSYRSCGYRAGWLVVSGDKKLAQDYIEGLNMLSNMRLCANVPGQWAIQTALGGYQSINDLTCEGGRLRRQRDLAYELITAIPGVTCVKPTAALYMFPKLDPKVYPIEDDRQFFLEMLKETKVMLVQGTGFNWATPDHFRIVFLPHEEDLREAVNRIARFLERYRQRTTQ